MREPTGTSCAPSIQRFSVAYYPLPYVLDAMIAPASFDGLLDREVEGFPAIGKAGYIAGRAGMTAREVMDQLDRERHEAVARMTGIGLMPARSSTD